MDSHGRERLPLSTATAGGTPLTRNSGKLPKDTGVQQLDREFKMLLAGVSVENQGDGGHGTEKQCFERVGGDVVLCRLVPGQLVAGDDADSAFGHGLAVERQQLFVGLVWHTGNVGSAFTGHGTTAFGPADRGVGVLRFFGDLLHLVLEFFFLLGDYGREG
jgi:hypothetical protein